MLVNIYQRPDGFWNLWKLSPFLITVRAWYWIPMSTHLRQKFHLVLLSSHVLLIVLKHPPVLNAGCDWFTRRLTLLPVIVPMVHSLDILPHLRIPVRQPYIKLLIDQFSVKPFVVNNIPIRCPDTILLASQRHMLSSFLFWRWSILFRICIWKLCRFNLIAFWLSCIEVFIRTFASSSPQSWCHIWSTVFREPAWYSRVLCTSFAWVLRLPLLRVKILIRWSVITWTPLRIVFPSGMTWEWRLVWLLTSMASHFTSSYCRQICSSCRLFEFPLIKHVDTSTLCNLSKCATVRPGYSLSIPILLPWFPCLIFDCSTCSWSLRSRLTSFHLFPQPMGKEWILLLIL